MSATELQPGQILDDTYRIVRRIGEGGMGRVYEAAHARLAGRYALKMLREELSGDPELMARFRREAQITSSLRHPNIVQVVDFRTTPEGLSYIVMEFLDGVDLAVESGRVGALPLSRVRSLVDQIATGLAAAHEQGIVHRDLKPANLFLLVLPGSGRELVKIVDFGISKDWGAGTKLTQTATVMGTPQYMAPEQAMGQVDRIEARSDQFSLATITYELLAGRCAFTGNTIPTLLYQLVHEEPPPIVVNGQPLPPAVDAVIRRGLAKEPANRFANVIDFARALDAAVSECGVVDSSGSVPSAAAIRSAAGPALTTLGNTVGETATLTKPVRNPKPVVIVGSVAVAALILVLGALAFRGRAPAEGGAGPSNVPVAASTLPPVAGGGIPAGGSVPTGAAAAQVTIGVEDPPPSLVVSVDGVLVGPPPVRLARSSGRHNLVFEAPGYRPYAKQLDSNQDLMLVLSLTKSAPSDKRKPGRFRKGVDSVSNFAKQHFGTAGSK